MIKVIVNKLKGFLSTIIFDCQSAFVPNRSIVDNILVAFELIHAMRCNRTGRKGNAALKLDISQAYDRVDWHFL